MKKKLIKISIAACAMLFSVASFAQNENDALRYSLINYAGTARFMGLSGAYTAVGADFSSLSQNPAGIGLYRKSEFTVTPLFSSNNTTARFMGNTNNDTRNTMYLGNTGLVYSKDMRGKAGPLVNMQFGFGINMMTAFNNRMIINGFNNENSLLTTYADEVNASYDPPSAWDDFGAGLAYDVNLIFYDSLANLYSVDMYNGNIQQTKTVETSGSSNEFVISGGANIADKLFLGITFAFPYLRYTESSKLTETDKEELNNYFTSFERFEYLETHGNGFNFKAGFIFMPVEFVRIGGSVHTPTNYFNMSDNYHSTMYSYFTQSENYYEDSPDGYFEYELKTPLRLNGGIAFILGKYGLISADYEYLDYSSAELSSYDYGFYSENEAIRTGYTSANNFRVGAEFKSGIISFRGGYNFYGTPYRGENAEGSRTGFSAGIGIREKSYFVDFSYNHNKSDSYYYLYDIAPSSFNTVKTNSYSLTMGFRF